ncbi:hypothetical protein GALL_498610 [mine drainage metagenome]|uniref:Uncharacterized protein n=1 Tax=mine drainage metagenome TaxID=410659 RepID=A0A1J5PAB5_9ZZZZ
MKRTNRTPARPKVVMIELALKKFMGGAYVRFALFRIATAADFYPYRSMWEDRA